MKQIKAYEDLAPRPQDAKNGECPEDLLKLRSKEKTQDETPDDFFDRKKQIDEETEQVAV